MESIWNMGGTVKTSIPVPFLWIPVDSSRIWPFLQEWEGHREVLSRTSGGFSHACSHGNVPNHADLTATSLNVKIPIKGEVSLYMTDEYPHDLKFEEMKGESDLVVMVKVVGTMAPILKMVA